MQFIASDKPNLAESALSLLEIISSSSDPIVNDFIKEDILEKLTEILNAKSGFKLIKSCSFIIENFGSESSINVDKIIAIGAFEALCKLLINQNIDISVFNSINN